MPQSDIVRMISRRGLMPAYRAALGLAPTVRISKPIVVFHTNHQVMGTKA